MSGRSKGKGEAVYFDFGGKYAGSSFFELLDQDFPHLKVDFQRLLKQSSGEISVPHGTTVLGLKYREGVLVAGDRLATEGHRVASRDVQKVYSTDEFSLMAIAGAAGPCIEMARLLRVELEHYEKIEGAPLELDGKANKLSQMIRANLPAAMQGLVVVPIFAGYDQRRATGRVWKYDITGGRYEETEYETSGSGGLFAKDSLKKSYKPGATQEEAIAMAIEALTDAADDDRATGGVDLQRGIYPILKTCSAQGCKNVSEEMIAQIYRDLMSRRAGGR